MDKIEQPPTDAVLLAYLLSQYDRLLQAHRAVVMDTPEQRDLHDRLVATFELAATPVRRRMERAE